MKTKVIIIFGVLMLMVFSFRFCSNDEDKPKKGKPDGLTVLTTDLEEKKITEEEAFVYRVQSVFNSPDTPSKYRTFESNDYGTRLMLMIKTRWNTFSPNAKKQLEPYYVSPLNPKSFINTPTSKKKINFLDPEAEAQEVPLLTNRQSIVSSNGKIRIWYLPAERDYANILIDAFDRDGIYEKEVKLMDTHPLPETTISDNKIDVFLVQNFSWSGTATPTGPDNPQRKYSGCIFINTDKYERKKAKTGDESKAKGYIKSILAHELFHLIQYAIDYGDQSWWWWQEATATWAENYVYPSVNNANRFKKRLFKKYRLTRSLTLYDDASSKNHEYYTYLFPLYLSQKNNSKLIGQLWKACEPVSKQILDIIPTVTERSLKDIMMEFALWMYNENPEKHFKEGNTYLTDQQPVKEIIKVGVGNNKQRRHAIEKMGILFEDYRPIDASVKAVDFSLADVLLKYPDLGVWAVIKIIGKEPIVEDWSEVGYRNFCFDLEEENLEKLVLIYVNASRTKNIPWNEELAKVTGYAEGCSAKLQLTWTLSSSGSDPASPNKYGFYMSGSGQRTESGQANVVFREVEKDPGYPEMGKVLIPYGGFSFTGSVKTQASGGIERVFQIGSVGIRNGKGSDTWKGNNLSENEYGYIELKLYWPNDKFSQTQEEQDIAQVSQMAGGMGALGGLLGQLQGMQQNLEDIGVKRKALQEGELAYDLTLEINNIPAKSIVNGVSENTTIDMKTPFEIYKVVPNTEGVYTISHTGTFDGGNFNISGTLRVNESLRKRKSI